MLSQAQDCFFSIKRYCEAFLRAKQNYNSRKTKEPSGGELERERFLHYGRNDE
jgi:hypothetical protein